MAETTTYIITNLEQNQGEDVLESKSYDLGATFNNVFLDEEDDFSLKDLFEHYKKVLENCGFVSYGENEPINIDVWYEVPSIQEEGAENGGNG